MHWKWYRNWLLEKLEDAKHCIALGGDAQHDSMGHNAKYGAYSVFSFSEAKVIHFELVQVAKPSQIIYLQYIFKLDIRLF